MRSRSLLLAILILIPILISAPAQSAEKFTVLLDWFVNPDHATLVVAKEKGYFAEAGLDVDLVAPANPNDPRNWSPPERPTLRSRINLNFIFRLRPGFR